MTNCQRSATSTHRRTTAPSVKVSANTADNQKHTTKTGALAEALQGIEIPAERLGYIQKQLNKLNIKERAEAQLHQRINEMA